MLSQFSRSFDATKAARRALLIFCLLIVAAARINAAGNPTPLWPSSSPAFNSVFAIADFDGDHKPDLATVEIQNGYSSGTTQYSIRFRLSVGVAQSFGVSAPAGGLQIVARDVNGDDALDLLVSTAWLDQQVAVLLNDGHGNFTLAKPDAFPTAVWKSETLWESEAFSLSDRAVLVRSEYPAEELGTKNQFHRSQSQPGQDSLQVLFGKSRLLLFALLGRAPPSSSFQA